MNLIGKIINFSSKSEIGDEEDDDQPKVSRHYVYTKHFPLCQDDASQHDCNQRYILLFGVGKERDEKKHAVKKMSKGNDNKYLITVLSFSKVKLYANISCSIFEIQKLVNYTPRSSAWI